MLHTSLHAQSHNNAYAIMHEFQDATLALFGMHQEKELHEGKRMRFSFYVLFYYKGGKHTHHHHMHEHHIHTLLH
jgi:hypothetical protein